MRFSRILLFVTLLFIAELAVAQCPMCKKAIETGMKEGSTVAKGLNTGILYLMVLPFISFATFGFFFWKKARKN